MQPDITWGNTTPAQVAQRVAYMAHDRSHTESHLNISFSNSLLMNNIPHARD
jgi:hypothetical protein